jgi:2-aminoadipate transaminase
MNNRASIQKAFDTAASNWRVVPRVAEMEVSVIREILKIASKPGVISFAGGLPSPDLFPLEDLKEAMGTAIDRHGPSCVQYTVTKGIDELRDVIAKRAANHGVATTFDNIVVTAGGQQGLDLVTKVLLNPGDSIICGNPSYVGALQVFRVYGAKIIPIELEDDGINVDQIESQLVKHRPAFIYTITDFQNPTGISMSLQKRRRLVELSRQYEVPIVEDNPYSDLRFEGERIPTLRALGGETVIGVRTFSKILTPGLRTGWLNADSKFLSYIEKVKQSADLHTTTLSQYLILEFMRAGKLEPHIQKIKKDYRAKRDLMVKTLREKFPQGISWTEPEGGLFLWITLPKHMSAKDLLPKAVEQKVAYVYGQPFHPDGSGANTLRINFSHSTPEKIVTGIERLAVLFRDNM